MIKKILGAIFYPIVVLGSKFWDQRRIYFYKKKGVLDATVSATATIQNYRNKPDYIKIGRYSILEGDLMTFKHGGEIVIGEYCYIGKGTKIWSAKKIQIGDRVLIAHNVNIHDNISHPLDSKERHLDQKHIMENGLQDPHFLHEKAIVIGDDAWIGFNVTVMKGVTIGKGAIVGACTVITHDVPDYAVVVGNPSRIIKTTT